MALKRLLSDEDGAIADPARWERRCEGIRARLFETIGTPPVTRNTRSIRVVDEEELDDYVRIKITYVVGDIPARLPLEIALTALARVDRWADGDHVVGGPHSTGLTETKGIPRSRTLLSNPCKAAWSATGPVISVSPPSSVIVRPSNQSAHREPSWPVMRI
jgi:hypothetical protein